MDTVDFKKGENIIEEGTLGDCAYIIEQGSVEVSKFTPHGEKQVLGVLEKSEIFGEMGLIDGLPRSATVTALENCVMSVCSRETFNSLADHNPESLLPIFKVLVRRLRSTLSLVGASQMIIGNDNESESLNVIYQTMMATRSETIEIENLSTERQKHTAHGSIVKDQSLDQPTPSEITTVFDTPGPQTPETTSATLQEMEKHALVEALKFAGGNVKQVAESLGISRTTCYRKIKKYQIKKIKKYQIE
ncbi:MAG TPA: cyclic nucleotide-binding domain-containing protein [Nitrospinaceae bacterium]|jgi:CRP-like cAMP-binding protein|nr:cyclic nucleotide-binding domain-containing protein [Nitrospinaceae bacterium]